MIVKVNYFAAVVLALIIGYVFGEIFRLENLIQKGSGVIRLGVDKVISHESGLHPDDFSNQYASLIVLFCMSGLGIFGSLTEGLTGDYQLLLIKSILDFFTAIIFSMRLGPSVGVIAVPQFAVQAALFFSCAADYALYG